MARQDDYMLTAEELRLRRRKRRRIFFAVALLVAFGLGGIFGGRPALNAIKGFQARRHASRAFAFIEQENWPEARVEAVAAYQLRPSEPQALRAVARFLSRTRQPDALEFWTRLAKEKPLDRDDLRDEAGIALATGETQIAESAVKSLLADPHAVTAADELLAAQLAIQKNLPDGARPHLEKIFSDARATERERLQGALLQLATAKKEDDATQRSAWGQVQTLAGGKTPVSLDALTLLARRALSVAPDMADASMPATADLVRALENHPLAKAPQKLFALDLQIHADASQRDTLIARAIDLWKNAAPGDLAVLAGWLNSKGEFQKTLDAISLEKALLARDLFLQHLDALGALDRWSEVKQLLSSDRFPLDPVVQQMYLARCSAQLGEKTAAENNWKRALEAAGGDVGKLITLANYAEKNGANEIAENAYSAAATESPKFRPAQEGRLRTAQAVRDTKKMHTVLAEMLRTWPNDPAIQNDEAYTRLLLAPKNAAGNAELRSIEKLAGKLVEREPASLPHRTLLALARLRAGRAEDALSVYKDLRVPQNALTGSALVVHAAVLAATGHMEDARTEAAQIAADKLPSEERALIQDLLQ
jgi:hypothetical protein